MSLDPKKAETLEFFRKSNILDTKLFYPFTEFFNTIMKEDYGDRAQVLELSKKIKNAIWIALSSDKAETMRPERLMELNDMYWRMLLVEAQNKQVDSYFLYLEKNRNPKDKFYQPSRKQFVKIGLVQSLQQMIDDELDLLSISLPPGTKKTTSIKFFSSGVIGWFPKDYNLFYSHSGEITRMFYDGTLDIVTNPEYTWNEIFPGLQVTNTNAKSEQFNIGSFKAFPSIQCTSVGSKNAGKVRANRFLLCDDLISGIEEALNKNMLDKLWNIYSVDARQRKVQGCKEIHICTRWSTYDIIARLQKLYEGNKRCKFLAVPDIDPETGKSNFNFDYNGFDEAFFHDQELVMDEISYKCLYKQEPIEREGLLYREEELRRYVSLPLKEPDAILGVCDTKTTGIDYMFLPVMYQYGDDYYLVDCICDDSTDFDHQYNKITNIILENKMHQVEFESNAGGTRIAFEINKRVVEQGGRCNITTHPTETNKETRIIVNADWIKRHVLFREKENYTPKSDYGKMMSFIISYSISGKNKFDDTVDGLAIFAEYITKRLYARRQAILISSPI